MKRVPLYFFIFTFSFFLSTSTAFAVEVDGIAATVDSQSVLRSDVIHEMQRASANGQPAKSFEETRNALIERKLIVKAAKASKMTMQEWVIDNRVREIIEKGFGGDRNKLIATLARDKIPYTEWRQRIKDDMIVSAMRWNVIDKYVTASPSEMMAEYKAHPEHYNQQGKVTVSVILLRPEDAPKRDEIKAALKDRPFGDLAKEYSAGTHATEGGVWKDVQPEEVFKPEICAVIAKLAKGETSDWIELDGWSFLVRKDDATETRPRSFAEAYEDIEDAVKAANGKKAYDAWMNRLKEDAYIKIF